MPEFKAGAHDRVYSAMLNKSLCLTDSSLMLKKQFSHGKELVFYQVRQPEMLCETVKKLLLDEEKRIEITENGHKSAQAEHTWAHRAKNFLQFTDNIHA